MKARWNKGKRLRGSHFLFLFGNPLPKNLEHNTTEERFNDVEFTREISAYTFEVDKE